MSGKPKPFKEMDLRMVRAAFYGLCLRREGYSPDETAALVVKRYPGTRHLLKKLLHAEESA